MRPALACLLLALAAAPAAAVQELRFRSGETLPARRAVAGELGERLTRAAGGRVLVRFARALGEHERALCAAAGLELGQALGGGAYWARVGAARCDVRTLERLGAEVRAPELGWKLHPALLAGETPEWAVLARGRGGEPTVALYVALQRGESLERGQARLEALGGGVLDVLESVDTFVAELPRARVAELAAADEVAWVEPVLPPWGELANDSSRALTQVDLVQAPPYRLDGSGVRVLVYDSSGANAAHLDFGGRLANREGTLGSHATHVAGTLGGDGRASGGLLRGMAPGVHLESYGFTFDPTGLFLFTNPGDLEADYTAAIQQHAVDLANNSIAINIEGNNLPCTLQGDYGVVPQLLDAIVDGALGAPFRIVWATGNERAGRRCDIEGFQEFYSLPPPATAKNPIAVGAVNSNDDTIAFFSSFGPCDDGRLKPDLCAPGCQTDGDLAVTSAGCCAPDTYERLCGTSMAAPTVTGIDALILEDYRRLFAGADPRNSTLKALLAHTAVDRGRPGPDYRYGYGSVRAKSALDLLRQGSLLEGVLGDQGARQRYEVVVDPGDVLLKLTLAWDDRPAAPSVLGSLVNDLDLVVLDPAGRQHHVWTLDPANPDAPAVRRRANRLDNLEQVFVAFPASGHWMVEVRGASIPDGSQTFSLVSSHEIAPAPFVQILFPAGLPTVLAPGVARNVRVRLNALGDTVVPRSLFLHARYDGTTFMSFPMEPLVPGSDVYQAALPPPACGAEPEFAFTVQGITSGLITSPPDAPASFHRALVADAAPVFADDFEAERGWSVVNEPSLLAGAWQRGRPASRGLRGDPYADYDGSGQCWLTGNAPGDSDVEGGPTRLVSPPLDLSGGGEFEVSYAWWLSDGNAGVDELVVELSNDDGAHWTPVVAHGPTGRGWVLHSFAVHEFLAPTARVRVRFSVADGAQDSVTEAALDAFQVLRRRCAPVQDCNANGVLDADDIASGRSADVDQDGWPDECADVGTPQPAARPTVTRERGR